MTQLEKMNEIKLGRYKHFKGGDYLVLGEATHSETKELLVVYRDLNKDKRMWARPKKQFLEEVEFDGPDGKLRRARFVYVGEYY